jgi:hypothetical protein
MTSEEFDASFLFLQAISYIHQLCLLGRLAAQVTHAAVFMTYRTLLQKFLSKHSNLLLEVSGYLRTH